MRQILFKAKSIATGEWVEGYLYKKYFQELPHDRFAIEYKTTGSEYEWTPKYMVAEIDPNTICQYTELSDKNGNKIWENDILSVFLIGKNKEEKENCIVRFGRKAEIFKLDLGFYVEWTKKNYLRMDICYWTENREVEVIGNVFDNPDLLKGE